MLAFEGMGFSKIFCPSLQFPLLPAFHTKYEKEQRTNKIDNRKKEKEKKREQKRRREKEKKIP